MKLLSHAKVALGKYVVKGKEINKFFAYVFRCARRDRASHRGTGSAHHVE